MNARITKEPMTARGKTHAHTLSGSFGSLGSFVSILSSLARNKSNVQSSGL
jgi:hypothetical protein